MQPHLQELTPTEVHDALRAHRIVLIDVREPQEYVNERIHGALLFPLSTFDPRGAAGGRAAGGAALRLRQALGDGGGEMHRGRRAGHRASEGRDLAWKHARFPTISLDPNTGAVVDRK